MLNFATALAIGGALAASCVYLSTRSEQVERVLCSGLLLSIGLWYLGFGIIEGATFGTLLPQIAGGVFFAVLGYLGLTRSLFFAGIGWLIHASWDFASPRFSDVSYMPEWAAPMCLSFDIALGVYLLARAQGMLSGPKSKQLR